MRDARKDLFNDVNQSIEVTVSAWLVRSAARASVSEKHPRLDFVCDFGSTFRTNASPFSDELQEIICKFHTADFESRWKIKSLLQICCEVCFDKRCNNGHSIRSRLLSCGAGNVPGNRSQEISWALFWVCYWYMVKGKFEMQLVYIPRAAHLMSHINVCLFVFHKNFLLFLLFAIRWEERV